jgi:hypothetical protein
MDFGESASKSETQPSELTGAEHSVQMVLGSVQYAFEISVDGLNYSDIEDYYTAQVRALKDKVVAAGYNADKVEFIGKLGFADFIQDMEIFVASSGGKQGRGVVDGQGNFSIALSAEEESSESKPFFYAIRANKRVQIILSSGGVPTKKLCYNFAAVNKNTSSKSILLNSFKTDFTLYDCEQQSNGLAIPESTSKTTPTRSLQLDNSVDALWVGAGNEFYVDMKGERRKYILPRSSSEPYALSEPETIQTQAGPVGFSRLEKRYVDARSLLTCSYTVPVAGDALVVHSGLHWTQVSVVHNNVSLKTFKISPFGLDFFVVSGDRVFAIGRYDGDNIWKVGELDFINNRFLPRAEAPTALAYNMAAGLIDGEYVAVAYNKIFFYRL